MYGPTTRRECVMTVRASCPRPPAAAVAEYVPAHPGGVRGLVLFAAMVVRGLVWFTAMVSR